MHHQILIALGNRWCIIKRRNVSKSRYTICKITTENGPIEIERRLGLSGKIKVCANACHSVCFFNLNLSILKSNNRMTKEGWPDTPIAGLTATSKLVWQGLSDTTPS